MTEKTLATILNLIFQDAGDDEVSILFDLVNGHRVEATTETIQLVPDSGFIVCNGDDGTAFIPVCNIVKVSI